MSLSERQSESTAPSRAGGGGNRSRLPTILGFRFLVPVVVGGFALVTFATVFHDRYPHQRPASPLAALRTQRAAAASAQIRALAELANPARAPSSSRGAHSAAASVATAKNPLTAATGAAHVAGIPVAVRSPDGDTTWHVGPHGFISVYAIEGDHYVVGKQRSGVTADLLGGAAVSAEICWVVGDAGTILRTIDGGYHWERVKSPTHANIASVSAQSADDAKIRTAAGTRFLTTDGGRHWVR